MAHHGCFRCSAAFDTLKELREHMFDHDVSINVAEAVQAPCGHRFADMDHLNRHTPNCGGLIVRASDVPPCVAAHFGCFECGGAFGTEADWRSHMLYSHNKTVTLMTRHACKCGETFRSGYHLERHVGRGCAE